MTCKRCPKNEEASTELIESIAISLAELSGRSRAPDGVPSPIEALAMLWGAGNHRFPDNSEKLDRIASALERIADHLEERTR